MKWATVHPTLHCNNYCVYCGTRALDPRMYQSRREVGLSMPYLGVQPALHDGLVRLGLRSAKAVPFGMPRRADAFSLDSVKPLLEEQRRQGVEGIRFQGGEPTIWPHLPAAIRLARQMGFGQVVVVSNGRRLGSLAYATELMRSGMTGIVLSLLGHDAQTHDGVTLVPGSFEELLAGMRNCVSLQHSADAPVAVSSNVIVSGDTLHHISEQIALLADLGVDNATLHLLRFDRFGDDVQLRRRLGFPLAAIRAPLAAAFATARLRGVTIQAQDIPLCQHPGISAQTLRDALERSADQTLVHARPGESYGLSRQGRGLDRKGRDGQRLATSALPVCRDCMFVATCPRAPDEYLAQGEAAAFRAIGYQDFLEVLDQTQDLPAVDDAAESMRLLATHAMLDGSWRAKFEPAMQRAYTRLLRQAIHEDREFDAIRALHGLLGLEPMRSYREVGMARRVLGVEPALRIDDLRRSQAEPAPGATRTWRLHLALGLGLQVQLQQQPDGQLRMITASPLSDRPVDPVIEGVFSEHLLRMLGSVQALRCADGLLEGLREGRWVRLLRAHDPDQLRLQPVDAP